MENQKIENELNLVLGLTSEDRKYTDNLNEGYDLMTDTWELVIRYNGPIEEIKEVMDLILQIEILNNQYAIVIVPEENINALSLSKHIEFIEKPRSVSFVLNQSTRAACIRNVQDREPNLSGKGVLLGIIDSGIDYSHSDFRNDDGSTRIHRIWDMTIEEGIPPDNFIVGTIYTREEINLALAQPNPLDRLAIVPSEDTVGHGTHVAGIAGGNGKASNGVYRGVAPESDFIIVKIGARRGGQLARTTEIMRAITYIINEAEALGKPVAINISLGYNFGSHDGRELFESYMDNMSKTWKNVMAVGSGNEGAAFHHTGGTLEEDESKVIELSISPNETNVYVSIWKNYIDTMDVLITSPSGYTWEIEPTIGSQTTIIGRTKIIVYYGEPSPYNMDQEIYIQLIPTLDFVDSGVWKITLIGFDITVGNYDLWLPSSAQLKGEVRFLEPTPETTITLPSTASNVITVGAYNSKIDSLATFSGRGYTRPSNTITIKPDLVAPGVDIISTVPGGGYDAASGTSMSAPFVTGSAALLMEWGIIRGNDLFLYGEKVRSYLLKGAKRDKAFLDYPNPLWGFGTLCLSNVFSDIYYKSVRS